MTVKAQDGTVSLGTGNVVSLTSAYDPAKTAAQSTITLHFLVGDVTPPADNGFIGQLNLSGTRYDPRFHDDFLKGLTVTFDIDTVTTALQGQSQVITGSGFDAYQQTFLSFGGSFPAIPDTADTFTISGVKAQELPLVAMDGNLTFKLVNIKNAIDTMADGYTLTAITNQLTSIKSDTSDMDPIIDNLPDSGHLYNLAYIASAIQGAEDSANRAIGKTQLLELHLTNAANAGPVTLATVTTSPILIKSVIVYSNGATTSDFISIAVTAGAGDVLTLISAGTGVQASLDAADKQVSSGNIGIRLDTSKTIVATFVGSDVTPIDFTVMIEYEACANGGYLA